MPREHLGQSGEGSVPSSPDRAGFRLLGSRLGRERSPYRASPHARLGFVGGEEVFEICSSHSDHARTNFHCGELSAADIASDSVGVESGLFADLRDREQVECCFYVALSCA